MNENRYKLSEHPFVIIITVIGGIIAIFIFVTGIANLPDLYKRWFLPDLYDNFNDTRYDGRVNPSLWEIGGNPKGEATQLNGVLIIQTNSKKESGNFALFPTNPRTVSYQNFKYMEAKFKLDKREAGKGSFLKIQAVTVVDENYWWIECKFTNQTVAYPVFACNLEEGVTLADESPVYAYETDQIPVSYDAWYTIRFVSDPGTGEIRFYLDNRLIGESAFSNASALRSFHSFRLQVGSWIDPENSFLGYVDDVKIGTEK